MAGPADSYEEEHIVRLPLDVAIEQRTGEVFGPNQVFDNSKDSAIVNAYVEVLGENRTTVVKRPGREMWSELRQTLFFELMGIHYKPGQSANPATLKGTLAVVFANQLFINPEGVWQSGEKWTASGVPTAPWATSTGGFPNTLQLVYVNSTNTIAVISGRGGLRSVYRTIDAGATWTLQTSAPGWVARADFQAIATSSTSVYVMGGRDAAGTLLNDVWRSTDSGVTWTQMTAAAAWSAREKFALARIAVDLYVMGGTDGGGVTSSVYKSTDNGATWTLQSATPGWAARDQLAAVGGFSGSSSIIMAGGASGATNFVDAWITTDGIIWRRATEAMPFSARALSVQNSTRWIASDGGTNLAFAEMATPSVWQTYTADSTIVPSQGNFASSGSDSLTKTSAINVLRKMQPGPFYQYRFFNLFTDQNIGSGDIEPVFFEDVPLPDLNRNINFQSGRSTSNPSLEGFFFNGPFDSYFYNTKSNTLTKVTSPNYPYQVVGGAAWLNGRFYVMTPEGRIYNSGINDPLSWNALDFINAIMHPDRGTGVYRKHTYIMAMGRSSTEWFYDSGAALGNPLRRVDSAAHDFGCFHAGSVQQIADVTIFAGTTDTSREIGVFILDGYVPKKVSTPFIDRIFASGDFDCMWSYQLFHNGHRFYVLNTCCQNFSVVYDLDTNRWFLWTSTDADVVEIPTMTAALDASSGLVEVTCSGTTGLSTLLVGYPITVENVTETEYNGDFVIHRVIDANNFTYVLPTSTLPVTPATGANRSIRLMGPLSSGEEWRTAGAAAGPSDSQVNPLTLTYLLDRQKGNVYTLDSDAERDDSGILVHPLSGTTRDDSFIDCTIRTPRWDAANNLRKFVSRAELIGDITTSDVVIRYSDDDYQTWTPYRKVKLIDERPRLSRQGSTRKRAYQVSMPYDIGLNDRLCRFSSLELFYKQGVNV